MLGCRQWRSGPQSLVMTFESRWRWRDITTGESVGLHFLINVRFNATPSLLNCFPVYYGWHSFTSNCDKISQELAATGISHDWLSLLTSCHLLILFSFLLNGGVYSNHHRCPSLIYLYNETKRPLWFNTKDLLMDFLALWRRLLVCVVIHIRTRPVCSPPQTRRGQQEQENQQQNVRD